MTALASGLNLLPYAYLQDLFGDYAKAGHVVHVWRDRNGNRHVRLDGGRRLTIHQATAKVEAWIQAPVAAFVSEGLGEMTDFCPSDNT